VANLDNGARPGEVCLGTGLWSKPPYRGIDGQPLPAFTVNLDLPPDQRWVAIAKFPQYSKLFSTVWSEIQSFLNAEVLASLIALGDDAWSRLNPVFQGEIQGSATALNLPRGVVTLLNLLYDITDGCTSIVAQMVDGSILHARNLDFGTGMDDTELLRELAGMFNYTRNGSTVFAAVGFPFYSGVLTGFKPGAFAVTVNTRFLPKGPLDQLTTAINFLLHNNASPVTFVTREVMENMTNYFTALELLVDTPLIDDVYYTLSGTSPNQGTVITRSRNNASDIWHVSSPETWYILQTNYDHWLPAPWYDDRADPGNALMTAMGQKAVTLPNIYANTLSVKPVMNMMTIMTVTMSVDLNVLNATVRTCSDPCPF
jgi:hypothetical protein